MKEVLEYTEEELRNLSNEDLLKLRTEALDGVDRMYIEQFTKKILINALYGATANRFFPLFNPDFAASITANGRYFIQKSAIYVEEALQKVLPSEKPYTVYGDTDSSDGNTYINILTDKEERKKIMDLYEEGYDEIEYKSGKFLRKVNNISSLSVNSNGELEYKPIVYVMKHKVSKRMFRVKVRGNEVIITNDHSLMIKRNGSIIECKPFEVQKGDKIIMVKKVR